MAQNLRQLRRRIKTARNIMQVTRAMEMIAASKIKKAQATVVKNTPHAQKVEELTNKILATLDIEEDTHPYITGNPSQETLLIVVSSDKGLCGSLNTNIFKKLLEQDQKNTMLITVGKKIERFSAGFALPLVATFPMGTTIPGYEIVHQIKQIINEYYLGGKVSQVNVLYSEFRSIFTQVPSIHKLLPVTMKSLHSATDAEVPLYVYEPNQALLLSELLPHYLEVKLYFSIIQAYTSEQAARMIAMQNAKNSATDIAEYFTLTYNKARQERITSELLDLTNSQLSQAL